jgi:hypothetical protein
MLLYFNFLIGSFFRRKVISNLTFYTSIALIIKMITIQIFSSFSTGMTVISKLLRLKATSKKKSTSPQSKWI